MMIKERFIEQYGLPKFTIGSGGSGGAIQQHLIAHNYPGLLDALTPVRHLPGRRFGRHRRHRLRPAEQLLHHVANPADWPGERRSKVDGYPLRQLRRGATARQAGRGSRNALADARRPGADPASTPSCRSRLRYDPVTNRDRRARHAAGTAAFRALGVDPATGFARSAYDNVGVQYGLKALNNGDITKEEFLDMNEKVGGLDIDGNFVPHRSEWRPEGRSSAPIDTGA